jgi:FkbM family methyltransferase
LYAARRLNAARVIVYEPTNENWSMLNDNIDLNDERDRIEAVNQAVGRDGVLSLNVETNGLEIHSSAYWYSDAPKREVPSVTLDAVLSTHDLARVDLLKVDCEGAEYDIFDAVTDDALSRIDRVTLEWHQVGDDTEQLYGALTDRLKGAGFRLWGDGNILRGDRSG